MATGGRSVASREARLLRDRDRRLQRRVRELARRVGEGQALRLVRFWVALYRDPKQPARVRLEAARELADRYGPGRQTGLSLEVSDFPPKLVEIVHYPPPPGWNGNEPATHELVDDGPRELPAHLNDTPSPVTAVHEREEVAERFVMPPAPAAPSAAVKPEVAKATVLEPRWSECPRCCGALTHTFSTDGRCITSRCQECGRRGYTRVEQQEPT